MFSGEIPADMSTAASVASRDLHASTERSDFNSEAPPAAPGSDGGAVIGASRDEVPMPIDPVTGIVHWKPPPPSEATYSDDDADDEVVGSVGYEAMGGVAADADGGYTGTVKYTVEPAKAAGNEKLNGSKRAIKMTKYVYESPNPELRLALKERLTTTNKEPKNNGKNVVPFPASELDTPRTLASLQSTQSRHVETGGSGGQADAKTPEDKLLQLAIDGSKAENEKGNDLNNEPQRLNPKLTKKVLVYSYDPPKPELRSAAKKLLAEPGDPSLVPASFAAMANAAKPPPTASSGTAADVSSDDDDDDANAPEEFVPMATARKASVIGSRQAKSRVMHDGAFVAPVYIAGKLQKNTGLWSCCGNQNKLGMYCDSIEARMDQASRHETEAKAAREAEEYARFVKEGRRIPWEAAAPREKFEPPSSHVDFDIGAAADNESSTLNCPMIISFTQKFSAEAEPVLRGLRLIKKIVQTGEGCLQCCRHEAPPMMMKVFANHELHDEITLLLVDIWKQLLECNFTRDSLIEDDVVMRAVFAIMLRRMRSEPHIRAGMACLLQCARSEACREYILDNNYLRYYTLFCKNFSKNVDIVRSVIRSFNWVATTNQRLVMLFESECIDTVLRCMKRHPSHSEVLAPAMFVLTRVSSAHPPAAQFIIKRKAIPMVINTLRTLYSNDFLQLEGLKMLRVLSRFQDGWDQISETKGGWQTITQGVAQGDALVHDLPGALNNPGWAIGETPYLSAMEKQQIAIATQNAKANAENRVSLKGAWTTHSLRQFMGLDMKGSTLTINNTEHEVYFEVITTLDLLPKPREEKEDWFKRVFHYERENDIQIKDMVRAIISMRKNKVKDEEEKEAGDEFVDEYVKPIYIAGKRYDQKEFEQSDVDLVQILTGAISEKDASETEYSFDTAAMGPL